MSTLTQAEQDALDATTFRRLLKHLDANKDVQNIDLMITANFCRNCLSKWYLTAAEEAGVTVDMEQARMLRSGAAQLFYLFAKAAKSSLLAMVKSAREIR